jgi:poly(hydroxyalkanoate) depolymerase family esterase
MTTALLAGAEARAASLQKVSQSDWQGGVSLPSYVNMYIYVPDKLAAKPPILVASHHCQGTGTTTYSETKSSLVPLADSIGFIMIFPEATGHNCWDVGSAKSLKHDGGGDTHAVAQMVRYTLTKYSADASRVYGFGGSSGAMMTQALMGVYPDIFTAGVAVSGVPCGCWSVEYSGDVATNGQWSGPCAGGKVTKTAQEWGDQVRAMFPGYTGHRPRLQLWHGDPDPTINYANMGEAIKEWTNLLGLGTTPTTTANPDTNTTHQTWKSTCGAAVLEAFSIKGAGHGVQWDTPTVAGFFGLNKAGDQDPEAGCGTVGGTGGTGGGGSVGSGGAGGAGDGGIERRDSAREASPADGASNPGSGGSGGSTAKGGETGSGGAGSGGKAGNDGTGGTPSTGGSSAAGGSGSGGVSSAGGSSVQGGAPGSGGATTAPVSPTESGCGCVLGRAHGRPFFTTALLLSLVGLGLRRRRWL